MSLAAGWRQCSSQSDTGLTIQIDWVLYGIKSGGVLTNAPKRHLQKPFIGLAMDLRQMELQTK